MLPLLLNDRLQPHRRGITPHSIMLKAIGVRRAMQLFSGGTAELGSRQVFFGGVYKCLS